MSFNLPYRKPHTYIVASKISFKISLISVIKCFFLLQRWASKLRINFLVRKLSLCMWTYRVLASWNLDRHLQFSEDTAKRKFGSCKWWLVCVQKIDYTAKEAVMASNSLDSGGCKQTLASSHPAGIQNACDTKSSEAHQNMNCWVEKKEK
jgi:hypothetical protein